MQQTVFAVPQLVAGYLVPEGGCPDAPAGDFLNAVPAAVAAAFEVNNAAQG